MVNPSRTALDVPRLPDGAGEALWRDCVEQGERRADEDPEASAREGAGAQACDEELQHQLESDNGPVTGVLQQLHQVAAAGLLACGRIVDAGRPAGQDRVLLFRHEQPSQLDRA